MNNFNKNLIGFWLYIISDCIMFSIAFLSFITSKNYILKNIFYNYRIVLIETIILLICSHLTTKILNQDKFKYYFLNIIFSLIFLLMEFKDFFHLYFINLDFKSSNFMSNYYFIVGFHAFHVIISIILSFSIIFLHIKKKNFKFINIVFSLFWHFIHIVWLFLTFIIYIKK